MMRKIYILFLWLLMFCVGFVFMHLLKKSPYDHVPVRSLLHDEMFSGGEYLRLVFIGADACAFSNNVGMHRMIVAIKEHFSEVANDAGFGYISTGISIDIDAPVAYRFLAKSGPYDEVIMGASWYNSGVDRFIWHEKSPSVASVPQIVITRTNYEVTVGEGGIIHHINRSEDIVQRWLGAHEIGELYENVKESRQSNVDVLGIRASTDPRCMGDNSSRCY